MTGKTSLNLPEEKLPIEVGHINSVHVNHMDETKSRQGLKDNKKDYIKL